MQVSSEHTMGELSKADTAQGDVTENHHLDR